LPASDKEKGVEIQFASLALVSRSYIFVLPQLQLNENEEKNLKLTKVGKGKLQSLAITFGY
jgi:hypothetical protein